MQELFQFHAFFAHTGWIWRSCLDFSHQLFSLHTFLVFFTVCYFDFYSSVERLQDLTHDASLQRSLTRQHNLLHFYLIRPDCRWMCFLQNLREEKRILLRNEFNFSAGLIVLPFWKRWLCFICSSRLLQDCPRAPGFTWPQICAEEE